MGGKECRRSRSSPLMNSLAVLTALAVLLRHAHCQRLGVRASVATAAALALVFGSASSAPGLLYGEAPDAWDLSDTARERELQRLKQGILEGLGLKKLPDTSRMNVSQEEYERMYQVYLDAVAANNRRHESEALLLDEDDEFIIPRLTSRRYYSFTYDDGGEKKGRFRRTPNETALPSVFFPIKIPEVRWRHRDATVRRATLRLLVTASPGYRTPPEVIVNIMLPSSRNGSAPTIIEQRQVNLTPIKDSVSSRWMDFDVTNTVSKWLMDPASNKGLLIECYGCSFATHASTNDTSIRPQLNVFINVRGHYSRTKRSYDVLSPKRRGRTDCRKDGERCCRHQMEVVFDQLKGFEFILQPKKFDAGFCKGRCPPRYNPAHHHALLQSLIWKQNRKLAPKPCCAPSKLKSLEILRLDEDDPTRLKVSHWENIEVTECACS